MSCFSCLGWSFSAKYRIPVKKKKSEARALFLLVVEKYKKASSNCASD